MDASELRVTERAPVLRRAHGARALEALLLADLRARQHEAGGHRPLLIVTPSESARLHLAAVAARASGGTLVGVRVLSLSGAAVALLERTAASVFTGTGAFELFVRRRARTEARLRAELEHLDQGWRAVARSVRDLVDAGFDEARFDALVRTLADEDADAQARAHERARALLRVARATLRDAAQHDVLGPGALLLQAARALARSPSALRAAEVWIHGCGDARGSERAWIEALVAAQPATVYLDTIATPDALSANEVDLQPTLLRANGRESEVRACATRVQVLLAAGVLPERVLVVARDLAPYATAIRLHFGRLGLPYSGLAATGSPAPVQRRLSALIDVLHAGIDLSVERWLDARAPIERTHAAASADDAPRVRDLDLLLACRALGAVRLRELEALDWRALLGERQEYVLPLGRGALAADEEADGDDEDGEPARRGDPRSKQRRRTIARHAFEREQADARALCRTLSAWPERERLGAQAARLLELATTELGWQRASAAHTLLALVLARLAHAVPPTLELTRLEFVELVRQASAEHGSSALGGNGGGVQCLSAEEARGRTAEHLFVLGLNQGVFPALAPADPLLVDGVRRKLASVLPELELRSTAFARERSLFEGLLRAGVHVTLSWLALDEEQKSLAPSSFLARFLEHSAEIPLAPPVLAPALVAAAAHVDAARTPRPAHEHAVLAALSGVRPLFARALPYALSEAELRACASPAASAQLARVRIAILDEIDPSWSAAPHLGPYFGFVGARTMQHDPRNGELYVTTLEALARCAWQCHLTRFLKLAPAPDPLGELPSFDARMIGNTVHAALQRLVRTSGVGASDASASHTRASTALSDVLRRAPLRMRWPAEAELDALLVDVAREVLQGEGIVLPGLARALANQARTYVNEARALEDADPELSGVLGAEIDGEAAVLDERGATRTLRFRVDRVDGTPTGPVLIDYKTGKPLSEHKTSAKRREVFEGKIACGAQLQAALYVRAAGAGARGRYLFLKPKLAADGRCFEIGADTPELQAAFTQAASVLLRALDGGGFLPRVFEGAAKKEPAACGYCEVRQACNRGDSGARGRLERWIDARVDGAHEHDSAAERQALELWNIGRSACDEPDAQEPGA